MALLLPALVDRLQASGAVVVGTEHTGPVRAPDQAAVHVAAGGESALSRLVGTHVVVAPSRGRSKRSRRRWSVGVTVHRWVESPQRLEPSDVEVTTCRAGGPGGQHVNTTDSAVRVCHRPTGLSLRVADQRSQARNRSVALARLAARLRSIEADAAAVDRASRWRAHQVVRECPVCEWVVGTRGGLTERSPGAPVRVLPV